MPEYIVTVELQDAFGRKGRKKYLTKSTVVDHAAAMSAANSLIIDLVDMTEMEVLAYTVGQRTTYADSVTAGANIDEGATFTVNKIDNYRASHRVPAPVQSIRNVDGTIDVTAGVVIAYFDNFAAGGDFTVSDGETIDAVVKGTLDI